MKLNQVSPRQLICEDDMHRQYMTAWFQVSIGFAVVFCFLVVFEFTGNSALPHMHSLSARVQPYQSDGLV
jgi:hypothetical protein